MQLLKFWNKSRKKWSRIYIVKQKNSIIFVRTRGNFRFGNIINIKMQCRENFMKNYYESW